MLLLLKICMLMMRRHTFFSLCFPLVIMIPQLDLQLAMVKVRLFPFKKFASEWSVTWLEGHVLCCCCSLCVTMIFRHVRLVAFHAGNFLSELPIPLFISAIIHPTELYPHRHSDQFFVVFLQIVCSYVSKVQTNIQNSFSTFISMLQQYLCW